jgi:inner membrane protein
VALGVLAVLPDIDVVAFRLGIPYEHSLGHRGFTHSLAFAVLAGVGAACLFPRPRVFSRSGWQLAALFSIAAASHGVLDAFTDAGLGVGFFVPFESTRYFFPWRPLLTSPIGVDAFFDGPVLRILANELVWVWLPVGGLLLLGGAGRCLMRPPR